MRPPRNYEANKAITERTDKYLQTFKYLNLMTTMYRYITFKNFQHLSYVRTLVFKGIIIAIAIILIISIIIITKIKMIILLLLIIIIMKIILIIIICTIRVLTCVCTARSYVCAYSCVCMRAYAFVFAFMRSYLSL